MTPPNKMARIITNAGKVRYATLPTKTTRANNEISAPNEGSLADRGKNM
jgi:hypothetical protein